MELTLKKIEELNKKYNKNDKYKILENSLSQTSIKKVITNPRAKKNASFKFDTVIETHGITDQEHSGRCWMFAGLNILREEVIKKLKLEDFELSQNYLSFYDKLEKANYFMDNILSLKTLDPNDRTLCHLLNFGYQEGGQWTMFQKLVNKYGVVPKDLITESFQALNSYQMDELVRATLHKFVYEIANTKGNKNQIKDNYLEKIFNILTMCYGQMPTKFDFEYLDKKKKYHQVKDLNPKKFYKDYINLNQVKYSNNMTNTDDATYLNVKQDIFNKVLENSLDDKSLVWFGCDCIPYIDKDLGTWDLKLFEYDLAFDVDFKSEKGNMLDYQISAPNHAMLFSGYNKNPRRYKIENTWGDKSRDKGYYTATGDWFDTYVYQIVVDKKYLPKDIIKLLDQEPIILDPWDPLGSLAK